MQANAEGVNARFRLQHYAARIDLMQLRNERPMDLKEVIEFANQNPTTWLATVEDGVPHVRALLMWFADETGFYFHTASIKPLAEQLAKNGAVEAAFYFKAPDFSDSKMLRVNGTAEIVSEPDLEKRLLMERPWLETNRQTMVGAKLCIFRIFAGSCHFWNMAANGREKAQPRVTFSNPAIATSAAE